MGPADVSTHAPDGTRWPRICAHGRANDVVSRSVVPLRYSGVAAGEREALLVRGDLFAVGLHLRVLGVHVQQGMERLGLHVQRH